MIRAALYDTTTGVILQIMVAGNPQDITAVVGPGQAVAVAPDGINDDTHYVKNGVYVAYPPKPAATTKWDPSTATWKDPRTLVQIRADQKAMLRAARDAADAAGFTWTTFAFQSDESSRSKLVLHVTLGGLAVVQRTTYSATWTLADNTEQTFAAAQWVSIGGALGAFLTANNTRLQARKAAVDAATTPADVQAVVW